MEIDRHAVLDRLRAMQVIPSAADDTGWRRSELRIRP
jgi:hypothetical protein